MKTSYPGKWSIVIIIVTHRKNGILCSIVLTSSHHISVVHPEGFGTKYVAYRNMGVLDDDVCLRDFNRDWFWSDTEGSK